MAAKSSTRLLLWIAAIGIVILMAVTVAAVILLDKGPIDLAGGKAGWLHARVGGTLADAPGSEGIIMDPADMPPLTTELAQAFRDAATDETVEGLFLEITPISGGWGQVQELRDAVAEFDDSGKPCVAWGEVLTTKEYMLASACSTVYTAPAGITMVNGLSATTSYYKGTFEKLGVEADMEHVGDFKSAVEPYERTEPSEAAKQAMDALLDSLYGQFVQTVAEGRSLEPAATERLIDAAPMAPVDALDLGLVDGLKFRDEVEKETSGNDNEPKKMRKYLNERRRAWTKGSGTIAVVYAEGTIVSGKSESMLLGGQVIGDRTLRKQLEDLAEDDQVKAVVLRVNSPGGSGGASDAIWREIKLLRDKKPVVASMADYAASGGYYIAMAADKVVAQPNTITGSIGVFGGKINVSGLYEKAGINTHTYERGESSTIFSNIESFDEEDRAKYRRFLEVFYGTFLERAAEDRPLSVDELHEVAQGRVWTGQQALERQLVDELGGLDVAIERAAELARVEGYKIRRIPERKGFIDQLLDEMANPSDYEVSLDLWHPDLRKAVDDVLTLERVLADGGVAALLPWPVTL